MLNMLNMLGAVFRRQSTGQGCAMLCARRCRAQSTRALVRHSSKQKSSSPLGCTSVAHSYRSNAVQLLNARLGQSRFGAARGLCSVKNSKTAASNLESPSRFGRIIDVGLGLAALATILGGINFLLEFPEPCQIVWKECQKNPKAKAMFGENMSKNLFWDGYVGEGSATVTLWVKGSKEKGTVYGRFLRERDGSWTAVSIACKKADSHDVIGLVESLPAGIQKRTDAVQHGFI